MDGKVSGNMGGSARERADGAPQRFLTPALTALLAAQLCSLTGETVLRFVLPLHILNLTGSASLYGAMAAAAFVPYILLMPVGGVIADRVRKQRLMAGLDAVFALLALVYLAASGKVDTVALTFTVLMLLYAGHALYQPSIQASVPQLVASRHTKRAVALVSQVNMLTAILGPVLGGAVFGFFGIIPILGMSVATFAVSCVLIIAFVRMRDGGPAVPVGPAGSYENPFAIFVSDIREAAAFLKDRPVMWQTILFACALNLVLSAGLTVGTPYIVTEHWGLPNQFMGIAEASLGVGGLLGGVLVAVRPAAFPFTRVPALVSIAVLGLMPSAASLVFGIPSRMAFAIMALGLVWIMAFATCVTITLTSYLQTETPHRLVGKVVSLMFAAVNCATPLGQLVFGIASDALEPAIIECAMLAVTLVLALVMRAAFRRM